MADIDTLNSILQGISNDAAALGVDFKNLEGELQAAQTAAANNQPIDLTNAILVARAAQGALDAMVNAAAVSAPAAPADTSGAAPVDTSGAAPVDTSGASVSDTISGSDVGSASEVLGDTSGAAPADTSGAAPVDTSGAAPIDSSGAAPIDSSGSSSGVDTPA